MNWLLERLAGALLGPAAITGMTDERMTELSAAMAEQFASLDQQGA